MAGSEACLQFVEVETDSKDMAAAFQREHKLRPGKVSRMFDGQVTSSVGSCLQGTQSDYPLTKSSAKENALRYVEPRRNPAETHSGYCHEARDSTRVFCGETIC